MRFLLAGIIALIIVSCDNNRIYEQNVDLKSAIWHVDSIKSFHFKIEDPSLHYNLYANFTNKIEFPYYNLYFRYRLSDSLNRSIQTGLLNSILFDSKTGEPKGRGIGDVFDQRTPVLMDYQFPYNGEFILSFQQYMRTDSLQGMRTVGARVEIAE